MIKRNALGRGLDSLISMDDAPAAGTSAINEIDINQISPNPNQPRTDFDQEALEQLAASIREVGIIQPLSLRKTGPDTFQIIAGERRFRASRLAGLKTVPAYIRTANETELTEMALIENVQRQDLNAIEIALTLKKLMDQHGLTQERLSERIGKNRATIANFLRLLKLPAEVQIGLRDGRITMGHAKALAAVDDPKRQLKLYNKTVEADLSVRALEELARDATDSAPLSRRAKQKLQQASPAIETKELQEHLCRRFNTTVKLACNDQGRGKITFPFKNSDELERLIIIFEGLNGGAPQSDASR